MHSLFEFLVRFARIKEPYRIGDAECCPLHPNGTDKAESRGLNYPWTPC